ncbi:dolichyl-phosphate-mannose--protein mannosyltransferase [Jonesia quinghaiensis]|uniref:dolichyl-phosphate-mannose--protein mannosyltransferase n=1 Tax=Jonesia quinghaiensis TaxID=262806 RepID=UPI00040541F5|nr:phospholipid carrier-dependent glycosyltransferase [Jonesia quinghaiensis]
MNGSGTAQSPGEGSAHRAAPPSGVSPDHAREAPGADGFDPLPVVIEDPVVVARRRLFSSRQLAMFDATGSMRLWGWLAPVLVGVVGGLLRFIRLGSPNSLVFDETYYVKGAYTLLRNGFENDWPKEIDDTWNAGFLNVYLPEADYVVHPPLGKWMIAAGMFPDPSNPFFWRFSAALAGTLAIIMVALSVRYMLGSTAWGVVAGGLFALDGVGIVHARTGLLDSFLMFWVVVAFVLLLRDRHVRRMRLARLWVTPPPSVANADASALSAAGSPFGPWLGWTRWRVLAALALGLACGVKWSGLYFLAVFCVMAVLWDAQARRTVGVPRWFVGALWRDAIPSAVVMLPTAAVGYLLAWTSWFANSQSYGRLWHVENPADYPGWFPQWVESITDVARSFVHYHQTMWTFHTGLSADHQYEAQAWGWLLQIRPTSFYWQKGAEGDLDCFGSQCATAITSIGNPLVWWLATAGVVFCVYRLLRKGDWVAGVVVAGLLAGWVPWLFFPERTTFTFYTIAIAPFMYVAVTYWAYRVWRWSRRSPRRDWARQFLIGIAVMIVVISVFYYPIWTAIAVPYEFWNAHMWFPSWI